MECAMCEADGTTDPNEALDGESILLAETDNGYMMCLACYAEYEGICHHCGSEDGIYPDITCKAEPWFCRECLDLPYRIHMNSCYSDGCLTAEEFSAECLRELEEEQHGGNPERSCKDKR
jgi:hypothetical protein